MSKKNDIILASNSFTFLKSYKLALTILLIKKGFTVTWAIPDSGDIDKDLIRDNNVNLIVLSNRRKGIKAFFDIYISLLKLILKNRKINIISHTVYINIALIIARISVPFLRSKHIITVTGFGASRIRNSLRIRFLGRLYLSLLRLASKDKLLKIITLNFNDLTLIQDFDPKRKVDLLHEAVVTNNEIKVGGFVTEEKLPALLEKTLNIGFFGRFLIEKGFTDYLNVYEKTKTLGFNFNFFLAGSIDPKNSSSVTIDDLKKYSGIEILIEPNYSDYFKKIDILIFSSYREGHPLYLLKAMNYGVVPIVYPVPGCVDVINNYNGLVVDSITPTSLLSGLIKLENNRKFLSNLSKNCNFYSSKFSEEKVLDDFSKYIISIIE